MSKKFSIRSAKDHLVLVFISILVLVPFLWALSVSLKSPQDIFTSQLIFIPDEIYLFENISRAISQMPLLRFLWNGFLVSFMIMIFQLLFLFPCAYSLSKLRFKGRRFILFLVLFCLLIPTTALVIPLFWLTSKLGLLDSYAGLVYPWVISSFGIFLFYQVLGSISNDYIDAAKMDGLNHFQIVTLLMVPMTYTTIAAFCVYSFAHHWNDLLWPSVITKSIDMATPPYGVLLFQSDEAGSDYGALMAGTLIIMLPVILIFVALRRVFFSGFSLKPNLNQKD